MLSFLYLPNYFFVYPYNLKAMGFLLIGLHIIFSRKIGSWVKVQSFSSQETKKMYRRCTSHSSDMRCTFVPGMFVPVLRVRRARVVGVAPFVRLGSLARGTAVKRKHVGSVRHLGRVE